MEIEHLNYPEAIRHLGGLYGVEIPETGYSGDSIQKEEKNRVKDILKEAAKYYYKSFNDPEISANLPENMLQREVLQSRLWIISVSVILLWPGRLYTIFLRAKAIRMRNS